MVRASLKFCGNLNTLYGTVFLNKATFATKNFSIFARQSLENPLFKSALTFFKWDNSCQSKSNASTCQSLFLSSPTSLDKVIWARRNWLRCCGVLAIFSFFYLYILIFVVWRDVTKGGWSSPRWGENFVLGYFFLLQIRFYLFIYFFHVVMFTYKLLAS